MPAILAAQNAQPARKPPKLGAVLIVGLTLYSFGCGAVFIVGMAHSVAQTGGRFVMPPDWSAMTVVGIVMFAIFGHIRLVLFRRFAAAVQAGTWPQAAEYLALIRQWVLVNLVLGALLIAGVLVF